MSTKYEQKSNNFAIISNIISLGVSAKTPKTIPMKMAM